MPDFNPNEAFDLADYDPQWPVMFERERQQIEAVMGETMIEIEHIGSTSVPGLCAKPIIDLLMLVDTFAPIEDYTRRLEPLGYRYQPLDDEADRIFFWKGVPRTHHLHIAEYATWEHHRHIIFRDYLRAHPEIAKQYIRIKTELVGAFKTNRPAYTRGKTAFINAIMARAVEEIIDPSLRQLLQTMEHDHDERD